MKEGRQPRVNVGVSDASGNWAYSSAQKESKVVANRTPPRPYSRSSAWNKRASYDITASRGKKIKLFKQSIACLVILFLALGLKNSGLPLAEQTRHGIRYLVTTETDFSPLFHKVVKTAMVWTNADWPVLDLIGRTGTAKPVITKVPDRIGPNLPLGGRVKTPFGWVRDQEKQMFVFHPGIDIKAEDGEPVKAVGNGEVVTSYTYPLEGEAVLVKHEDNLMTQYINLKEITVRKGDRVKKGQVIGHVDKGHLHFEVVRYGRPVDPLSIMTADTK